CIKKTPPDPSMYFVAQCSVGSGEAGEWTTHVGANITTEVLYANGCVYFGTSDHRLIALDARTGRTRWWRVAGDAIRGRLGLWDSNIVFVQSGLRDNGAAAIDAVTGQQQWY